MLAIDWWTIGFAMLFGGGSGYFRLLRRYPFRSGYALRHNWGRAFIGVSLLSSAFVCAGLELFHFPAIPGGEISNSISRVLLATLAGACVLKCIPLVNKQSGVRVVVMASAWINEILQRETDRVVAQEMAQIAMGMESEGVSIETLQAIGKHLVQYSVPAVKRAAQLARLDALAREKNFAGLIGHLLEYCAPEWLATLAKRQTQRLLKLRKPSAEVPSSGKKASGGQLHSEPSPSPEPDESERDLVETF